MGISQYSMYDISTYLAGTYGATSALKAENSTSRENNTELTMTDFLQLMIVQLQSQTLDDTMDTSEMMNQLVQMQMVTALTNMTETNIMTYASSLVGKEVTMGVADGMDLEERVVTITGTGYANGQYVVFGTDENGKTETYNLSQIMAVGKLPPQDDEAAGTTTPGATTPGTTIPGTSTTTPGATVPDDSIDSPVEGAQGTDETTDSTETPDDAPVENPGAAVADNGGIANNAEYDGAQGVPTDEM